MSKYVHIISDSIFFSDLYSTIESNFDVSDHHFYVYGADVGQYFGKYQVSCVLGSKQGSITHAAQLVQLFWSLLFAEKVIFHGLFSRKILVLLYVARFLLDKSYWVIWGGDLYRHQLLSSMPHFRKYEAIRKPVIKRMSHLITYIPGDVALARRWYGARGKYVECLMYRSNTFRERDVPVNLNETIKIQIGNSGSVENNHFEILEELMRYRDENIKIYAPLSYGDKDYIDSIEKKGKEIFGDKFIAMKDFMPLESYMAYLSEVDIAIFNHKRQQAMGNAISLLGLGKKVYFRSDVVQYDFFLNRDIAVFSLCDLDLSRINDEERANNIKKIKAYFSEAVLVSQWKSIFEC